MKADTPSVKIGSVTMAIYGRMSDRSEVVAMPLFVESWMNHEVVSVEEKTPVIKVIELFKLRRLLFVPVLRRGKVVGLIADRDVRDISPSKTAVMDVRELHYLLSRMKAGDIMQPNPTTIRPQETVETAALKMLEHGAHAIPVVDSRGRLTGIITQSDVLRVLIEITGISRGGVQLGFSLSEKTEGIEEITSAIKEKGGRIMSILGTRDAEDACSREVYIRIMPLEEKPLRSLIRHLKKMFDVVSVKRDPSMSKDPERA